LTKYLREKRLLLLLDNFEQIVEAAPDVTALLSAAPHLNVIATSREPLRVSGEHGYPLPPLDSREAVALFSERARAIQAGFEANGAVSEICDRLDGLPLAIELAAARVKLLPPAKLLERLTSRLALLTGGARDLPSRHQTLRATIDWSHDLLNPEEQGLFARLSVFVGGCRLEAAEHVCGADLDGLASLLDKSLLGERLEMEGEPRYRMLETVREYAQERLAKQADGDLVNRRLCEFFATLAEMSEQALHGGPDQKTWLDRLETEHVNMRAALDWAAVGGEADLALRLAGALGLFWASRGHMSEGRRRLTTIIDGAPGSARAKAVFWAGRLAIHQDDYAAATPVLERSLALARDQEDPEPISLCLSGLSFLATTTRATRRRARRSPQKPQRWLARQATPGRSPRP
jgi:predicted ATPase